MLINFRVTQVFHLNHRDVRANENGAPAPRMTFSRRAPTGELRRGNVYMASAGEGGGISFQRARLLFNSKERADMDLYCLPGRGRLT